MKKSKKTELEIAKKHLKDILASEKAIDDARNNNVKKVNEAEDFLTKSIRKDISDKVLKGEYAFDTSARILDPKTELKRIISKLEFGI